MAVKTGEEAGAPWFGPERQRALEDFWAIYEPAINLDATLRTIPGGPEFARLARQTMGEHGENAPSMRDTLRRAIAGDWAPYEMGLRGLGAAFARAGFASWGAVTVALSRELTPPMVRAYHHDPERLTQALLVKGDFLYRVGSTLRETYLLEKETINRATEARGAAIVRGSFDAIVSMDEAGRITEFNPTAETTFGHSREEVIGRPLADVLIPERHREEHRRGLARYLATGDGPILGLRVEVTGMRRDGTELPLELSVARGGGDGPPSFTAFLRDISARRASEEALAAATDQLRQSAERYRMLFDVSPVPMMVFADGTLSFLALNEAALKMYGYSREEMLAMRLPDVKVDKADPGLRTMDPNSWVGAKSHTRRDGTVLRVQISSSPIVFEGRPGRLAVALDVTEKESLEAQLRQSQKMEAVGSLAGGVAHDFNNLLSVILSYSELAAAALPTSDPLRADLEEIHLAGMRAAALTRQLLAFSRRQVLQPSVVSLNDIVSGIETMLRRLLGEDITLTINLAPSLGFVTVDPGQMEQVIMNLAVNARDAMPQGGRLTIETAEVELGEDYAAEHDGAEPGRHVVLLVSDSGCGMTRETQARIFEPFYTTKSIGKGTGLGLSTVFGIVRQSGGTVWVYSEPERGTTFKVYLPMALPETKRVSTPPRGGPSAKLAQGSETILLVEDDPGVRGLARTVLTRAGYQVLEAQNGGEALLLCQDHPGEIHLLLTDVVMPLLSGREVAERLSPLRPKMRVLYMSGYTDDAIVRHGILDSTLDFLQKPLTPAALARKVRDVLDAPDRLPDHPNFQK